MSHEVSESNIVEDGNRIQPDNRVENVVHKALNADVLDGPGPSHSQVQCITQKGKILLDGVTRAHWEPADNIPQWKGQDRSLKFQQKWYESFP